MHHASMRHTARRGFDEISFAARAPPDEISFARLGERSDTGAPKSTFEVQRACAMEVLCRALLALVVRSCRKVQESWCGETILKSART